MKVLVIGCGSIGRRHITNMRALYKDDIEIMAYRTFAKAGHLTEDFFEKYEVDQYSSFKKALSKKPDVTFITNPTSLHIPFATKAAEAGSHLFIEKPLSNNMKGIKRLQNIVKHKRLITFIGFNLRFYPVLNKVYEMIQKKEKGDIISIRAEAGSYLPEWHHNENYSSNYSAIKELGGGVILDYSHEIDYTNWLLGKSDEIQQVFCYGGKYSNLNINTEDTAEILMKSDKSIISIHLDYLQHPATRKCTIVCTKGKINIDLINQTGKVFDNFGGFLEISMDSYFDRNSSYITELNYFFDCIKQKKQATPDIEEGKHILEIALAAKKSMRVRKPIRVVPNPS